MTELLDQVQQIDGGYCVKRLDDNHCVDVIRMAFNWRIVVTYRAEDEPHLIIEGAWCYFGHGFDDAGRERTMPKAYQAAMAAALAWDGVGDPPGFDKRALAYDPER